MQKIISIQFTSLFVFLFPILTFAQQTVGLFTKNTGSQDGFVLFSPNSSNETYLIDKCGKLVHKWNTGYAPGLDAYLLSNGNLLSTGKIANQYFSSPGSIGGLVQIFGWDGSLIWRDTISDSIIMQNHDVYPMPNGNILVCEWERFTASQAIAAGRDSTRLNGSPIWSIRIQEIKPTGTDSAKIVWEWRLWDHLVQDKDSTKPNYGIVSDHPELLNINYVDTTVNQFGSADWTHANSVSYNPELDQILISSRNLSEIYIIDHSTSTAEAASHNGGNHNKGGDLLYRWGNPAAYNRGTVSDRRLFVQHNAMWIPNGYPGAGNISFFNDGTGRADGNYSSADIIIPPIDETGNYYLPPNKSFGPDSSYWSYKAPNKTDFYSSVQGGVQKLHNGNVLICEATKGNFFEVDSFKNIVWRYVNPDGGFGPVSQGDTPINIACFKTNLYMENDPAFQKVNLFPGNPVELNPVSYNCYMSYPVKGEPVYSIAKVKLYNSSTGVDDSINTYCFLKGIVQSNNLSINNKELYTIQDSTGGITVSSALFLNGYTPSIGDSLIVRGHINQKNGLTYMSADSVSMLTTVPPISPLLVSSLGEKTESELVILKGYHLNNLNQWDTTGANGSFIIKANNNKGDTISINVLSSTNLYINAAKPIGSFDITGIGSQLDSAKPYLSGYYIIPRSVQDIESSSSLNISKPEDILVNIYPNPTSALLNITATLQISEIQISDLLGKDILTQFPENSKNISIRLNYIKPDIYLIKVKCGDYSRIEKIVKY